MGETADQIREEIDNQRQMLGENLQQLEERVKTTVDWRAQFEQRPMAGIGLAFGAGFLLSMLMPSGSDSNRSGGRSSYDASMSNYRVWDESNRWQTGGQPPPQQSFMSSPSYQPQSQQSQRSPEMNEITQTIDNIRGAVMGLAANRLRTFLAEAIPGFEEEYEQARRSRGGSSDTKIETSSGSTGSTGGSSGTSQRMGTASGTPSMSGSQGQDHTAHASMTGSTTPTS